LEDRLPPGDTVLGALVGRSLIGSTALALECTSAPANTAQGAQDSITTGSPISVTRGYAAVPWKETSDENSQQPQSPIGEIPFQLMVFAKHEQLPTIAETANNALSSLQSELGAIGTEIYDPLNSPDPFGQMTPPKLPGMTPSDPALTKRVREESAGAGSAEIGLPQITDQASVQQPVHHPPAPVNQALGDLVALAKFSDKGGGEIHDTSLEPTCLQRLPDGSPPQSAIWSGNIPTDGTEYFTPDALTYGAPYTLVVSGDFQIQQTPTALFADAQFAGFSNPASSFGPTNIGVQYRSPPQYPLEFAPEFPMPQGTPLWGNYRPDHVYFLVGFGQGQVLYLHYVNLGQTTIGNLRIDIY
jgi:hypothetical protein